MELRQKVARMALGYDKYELVKGTDYVDSLVAFHKDAMEILKHLDLYSTDDRLTTKTLIVALIKQGEAIEEYD